MSGMNILFSPQKPSMIQTMIFLLMYMLKIHFMRHWETILKIKDLEIQLQQMHFQKHLLQAGGK